MDCSGARWEGFYWKGGFGLIGGGFPFCLDFEEGGCVLQACILLVWLKRFRVFKAESVWTGIVHKGGAAASAAESLATDQITATLPTEGIFVALGQYF